MTNYENYVERKSQIRKKLSAIKLDKNSETKQCWVVASNLSVSGTTIKNYLEGRIADGYLAEAIYKEFKKIKKSS